jgi:hypothetical protein
MVEWLTAFWDKQAAVVTYKEIKEGIDNAFINSPVLEKWQKDYANLVNTALAPQWLKSMSAETAEVKAQYSYLLHNPAVDAEQTYIKQHSAELITAFVKEQKAAIQSMIAQAAHYGAMTADIAARVIRPVIGLTVPQVKANLNYWAKAWETGVENGLSSNAATKRADKMAATYAAKQHRYRAMTIARTELAMAYNEGNYVATKNAQEQGYIGECKKTWLTNRRRARLPDLRRYRQRERQYGRYVQHRQTATVRASKLPLCRRL